MKCYAHYLCFGSISFLLQSTLSQNYDTFWSSGNRHARPRTTNQDNDAQMARELGLSPNEYALYKEYFNEQEGETPTSVEEKQLYTDYGVSFDESKNKQINDQERAISYDVLVQYSTPAPTLFPPTPSTIPPRDRRKTLSMPCNTDNDCAMIPNSFCNRQTLQCACDVGFVSAEVGCLPIALNFGDACVFDIQCSFLHTEALCYMCMCMCEPIYYIPGSQCSTPVVTQPPTDVQTSAPMQTLQEDYNTLLFQQSQLQANQILAQQGGIQILPAQNQITPAQFSLTCVRKRALGETCCQDMECSARVTNSFCTDSISGVCSCLPGFTPIGNLQCTRITSFTTPGSFCSVSSQCSYFGGYCQANQVCGCAPGLVSMFPIQSSLSANSGNLCLELKNLGETCGISAQCQNRTRNSQCASTCVCSSGFFQRGLNINECVPMVNSIGPSSPCTISQQCTVTGAICERSTGTCRCNPETHAQVGSICEAKVSSGALCSVTAQCQTIGASCSTQVGQVVPTCSCPTGFIIDSRNNTCVLPSLHTSRVNYVFRGMYCCFANTGEPQAIGQVHLTGGSTVTDWMFSLTGTGATSFTIMQTGQIFLNAGANVAGQTDLTFTATSVSLPGLVDSASVTIFPSTCCTRAPTFTAGVAENGRVDIMLEDGVPGDSFFGCSGTQSLTPSSNAAGVYNIVQEAGLMMGGYVPVAGGVFTRPCDQPIVFTNSVVLVGDCSINAADQNLVDFTGATELLNGQRPVCTIGGTVTGCNGVTFDYQLNVAFTCTHV